MPTENQSSNEQKMISFPRELSDDLAELIAEKARVCGGGAYEIWEAICTGFGASVEQHQGEPDGTTSDKYRAELYDEVWQKSRDMGFANVTDALAALEKKHQGESVAPFYICTEDLNRLVRDDVAIANVRIGKQKRGPFTEPLYIHPAPADSGEVERLRAEVKLLKSDLRIVNDSAALGAKILADREALLDRLRNHLIAKGVLGEFGPELFQILNIEAPERAARPPAQSRASQSAKAEGLPLYQLDTQGWDLKSKS